jgi:hypothetical protein
MWRGGATALALCVILNIPISDANSAPILAPDITVPLPASWTMMLIGLGLGFAVYRLFGV